MTKKIFIIAATAIVLIGILVFVYFKFFSSSATLTVGTGNSFPSAGTTDNTGSAGTDDSSNNAGKEVAPGLVKVTDGPVSEGLVALDRISTTTETVNDASSTPVQQVVTHNDVEVRYIDRASGNIYSYLSQARTLSRIGNKTLPGIQQASWLPDGSTAFVQFLSGQSETEHVETYALPSSGEGGNAFEQDLAQATAVGSTSVFTLFSGTTGSVGSVAKQDGTGAKTLFTSVLSRLTVYPTRSSYFAVTRPSSELDGYAFSISPTGSFSRILGPFRGLSVLPSPSGKFVLFSFVTNGTYHLSVLDVAGRTTTALPLATLSDKCVWSNDSLSVYCGVPTSLSKGLPDLWYQGTVSFSDRIWKIDMSQRVASLLIDPKATGSVDLDMVSLATDPSSQALTFIDRQTGSLWVYTLPVQ